LNVSVSDGYSPGGVFHYATWLEEIFIVASIELPLWVGDRGITWGKYGETTWDGTMLVKIDVGTNLGVESG